MVYGDNYARMNTSADSLGIAQYTYIPDTYAIRQSTNLYRYCGNNPLTFLDPTGNAWYHWVLGGVLVVAAAAGAFIGATAVYSSMVLTSAINSRSIDEFYEQGNWLVVVSTAVGGGIGGTYSYIVNRNSFKFNLNFTDKKLQHEFKHASDYGVTGVWNKINKANFQQAILNQMDNVKAPILGTYRGNIQVYHFYEPSTGLNTMIDMDGNFIGGWKLSSTQIENLLQTGNIQ